MRWIKIIAREVLAIFVDDFGYAFTILLWLAVVAAGVRFLAPASGAVGMILAVGLALILLESTVRRAKGRGR
jgi:fucose permease